MMTTSCTSALAALRNIPSAASSMGLLDPPDCLTGLPTGRIIADACPVACNMCTQGEAMTRLDSYACSCRPGWGDHNCDRWLVSETSTLVSAGQAGESITQTAGVPFATQVQALDANGAPIEVELGAHMGDNSLFSIEANDMIEDSTTVSYAGGGVYDLSIEIQAAGSQLVFVFADGGISVDGSPFRVTIVPNVLHMPSVEFYGPGCDIVKHGCRCDATQQCVSNPLAECFDGNLLKVRARDVYLNPRPDGVDRFGMTGNDDANDFSTSQATTQNRGEYEILFWWQRATYYQSYTFCVLRNDAGGADWPEAAAADVGQCTDEMTPDDIRVLDVYIIPDTFYTGVGAGVFEAME